MTAYWDVGTEAASEAAWREHRLRPRVLVDVTGVSTRTTVGGVGLSAPLLAAPTALHGLATAGAERVTVRACAEAGVLPVVSMRATLPLGAMGLPPGRWWQQLYVLQDRGLTREVAREARRLGAAALVVTGDAPIVPRRRQDLPPEALRAAPGVPWRDGAEQAADTTWRDVEELTAVLPVWVKGVLRADDAREALASGAAGVWVSNHGGRQLDGAVEPARVLAEVVDAVGDAVVVDGGIRSGRDVLTALALGARAVGIGRPVLRALAEGRLPAYWEGLVDDLRQQLQLAGVPRADAVPRDLVVRP